MKRYKLYRRLMGGIWLQVRRCNLDDQSTIPPYWVKVKEQHSFNLNTFIDEYVSIHEKVIDVEMYGTVWGSPTINSLVAAYKEKSQSEVNSVSDGYHDFGQLYATRNALIVALFNQLWEKGCVVWKSNFDYKGNNCGQWFIIGLDTLDKKGYITFYLPINLWNECMCTQINFAFFDGHDTDDVIERLFKFDEN